MGACDAKTGRTDGVIDDPASMSFDPEVLTCAEGQEDTVHSGANFLWLNVL